MRLSESSLRRIVREEIVRESVRSGRMTLREGRRFLREASSEVETDINAGAFEKGLGADAVKEIYPQAAELKKAMSNAQFTDGMAVVKPSKKGDGYDVFESYNSSEPLNKTPIPRSAFGKAGIMLGDMKTDSLSQQGRTRRGMK